MLNICYATAMKVSATRSPDAGGLGAFIHSFLRLNYWTAICFGAFGFASSRLGSKTFKMPLS